MKIKPKFGNHKNCLEATQLEIKKKSIQKKIKLMQRVLEKFIKNSLKTS